jgi:basic membrane lipoprotein Med (substrate-binding protein (PBP1-ABC) superfamily)
MSIPGNLTTAPMWTHRISTEKLLLWRWLEAGKSKAAVEALIDAGADLSLQRNDGMTALDIAKKNGAHHIALTIQAAIRIRLKSAV